MTKETEQRAALVDLVLPFVLNTRRDHKYAGIDAAGDIADAILAAQPAPLVEGEAEYIQRRLQEGGLRLRSGSPTMLSDEFARFESERAAALSPSSPVEGGEGPHVALCSDCPPVGYPTDKTRCSPCPRRASLPGDIDRREG